MPFIKFSNLLILLSDIKFLYVKLEEINSHKDSVLKDISKKFMLGVLFEVLCSLYSNIIVNDLKPNQVRQIKKEEYYTKIKTYILSNSIDSLIELGDIRNDMFHNTRKILDKDYDKIIRPINKDELLDIVKLTLDKINATEEHYLLLECINIIFDDYNRRDITNPIDLLKETSNNL